MAESGRVTWMSPWLAVPRGVNTTVSAAWAVVSGVKTPVPSLARPLTCTGPWTFAPVRHVVRHTVYAVGVKLTQNVVPSVTARC